MLAIVKRTEEELSDWLHSEVGFITTLCRYDDRPVELEPYQVGFLNDHSRFRWVTKSRQVGFSYVMALEALARCHLQEGHTSVFISYNLSDSVEKTLVVRQVFEDLPLAYQKKLVSDAKTELAFQSNGRGKKLSRVISVPSKAPRGKHGDIYLDELAHYINDREVYRGSTALILRSNGQLTGCSTPLGRRGIFWEIAAEEYRQYPSYSRLNVPWWRCRFFCVDPTLAIAEAPHLPTEERVARFGTSQIKDQLASLAVEDFQQEFENCFVDESYSYFAYSLILPNTRDDVVVAEDFDDIPSPKGRLVAGFDVGRSHDRSELAIFEQTDSGFVCRMLRTYTDAPFSEQEADLRRMLETLPIARLSIDRSGIGMNLAENLGRDYPHVVPENFTNDSKERWATNFKILLQRREVSLPKNRELVAQIHSIKRIVLPSGKVSFDAERTARGGHADKFWAIALATQKERCGGGGGVVQITARII